MKELGRGTLTSYSIMECPIREAALDSILFISWATHDSKESRLQMRDLIYGGARSRGPTSKPLYT